MFNKLSRQCYRVEKCFPPHGDVEGDVQVRLVTAGVELDVPEK